MRQCKVYLAGIPGSPYSQSAMHDTPMLDRETHEDFDIRTWREKCTTNGNGEVCIPAMGLKQAIDSAAYKLGVKVPNRRGATFKNFFTSGYFCDNDAPLVNGKGFWTKDEAELIIINAHADGRRGSGTRVKRRFPQFPTWSATAEFTITDDIITREIFEHHVKAAGMIVGIGRFRPENGGKNGRFRVEEFEWRDMQI